MITPAMGWITLFDGTVTLNNDESFTVVPYNNLSANFLVNRTTPLGALDAAAATAAITYNVTDKMHNGVLLLDDVDGYLRDKTNKVYWYAYVNDVYKDGYAGADQALNLMEVSDGDRIEFYYSGSISDPANLTEVKANATAAVLTVADIPSAPATDILFDGTVTLNPGETFVVVPYNNLTANFNVNRTTPLGALDAAAATAAITYNVTDKMHNGVLLLDDVDGYLRDKTNKVYWYAYVNDVYKDGYAGADQALNLMEVGDGDRIEFYYSGSISDPANLTEVKANATAAVLTVADISSGPTTPDWSLSLVGARNQTVTKTYFEQGLACTHMVNWTDPEGDEWSGIPFWLLVAMVDDNPDTGPDHFNFNDALAVQGYSVKVTAGDGYSVNFESSDIARNNSYLVANTLNGVPLPLLRPNTTKPCFPLQLTGPAVTSGKLIGNITTMELVGLPEPSEGWALTMEGDVVDVITQEYFEQGIVCHHNVTYTDGSGSIWTGVPLWDLVGAVDDIETESHWTFNDTRAAAGYDVRVIAGDGYNRAFTSQNVSHNNGFIVANTLNGTPLSGTNGNLKLVGPATTSSGQRVSNITTIRLEGLPAYPGGNWSLFLDGAISDTIPQPEFEDWTAGHPATYTDGTGNVYEGIPLWRLMGWVDDRIPHGSNGFNDALANAGYKVIVTAGDGYSKEFTSQQIGKTGGFIVAHKMNGSPLSSEGSHPPYPLRLVGAGLPLASDSVGNIVKIELTDFQEPTAIPDIHIIKYGSDGITIVNQTTVNHVWMEANLPVIGDGSTHYKFQGLTLDPSDIWDPNETKGMTPPKIENAIKGTKVRDLCDLVGGMDPGTEVTFVATDGYETTLPYDAIYTNPLVYSHLGDSVIAWHADGQYVPEYEAGPRLFFAPEDHVAGQWNMHEALPEQYWHYNWNGGVQYPSVAGLSARNIAAIEIYSAPVADWTIILDGEAIGGLNQTITRNYFESALVCTFANHQAVYIDSTGRNWTGMPLWFLVGFVDDADQHSDEAFNDTLAAAGYDVMITADDGYTATIPSGLIVRNNNYIVANTLNGTRIAESDQSWPLRLTGQNVTGGLSVKGVASIRLVNTPDPGPASHHAVFRSSTFYNWIFTDTLTNVKYRDHYGVAADIPLVADFNNDGVTDRAVFRKGQWIVDWSMDGNVDSRTNYGIPTDIPLVADFNNDGVTDRAVFRNGQWIVDWSMNGNVDSRTNYGIPTDIPLVADFNNDGVTDRAVFRNGQWIVDWSMNGNVDSRTNYGIPTDIPFVADFNNDGVTDRAVFRNGQWIADHSLDGSVDSRVHFGTAGDKPLTWM